MNHRSILHRICAFALLLGCLSALPLSLWAQQKESILVGSREREYYLHLPPQYNNSSSAIPLIIGLHGANQQAYEGVNSFASMTDLNKKADTEGFMVVYPVGIGSDILQVPTWNAGKCCLPASTSNMPDAEFISTLIDKLLDNYRIDKHRVYTMGFSNGGMMSLRLACELSNKIAAVVTHSGPYMYNGVCTPQRPVPVLYLHGQQDSVVPYYGGTGRLSTSFTFTSADSTVKIWRSIIGCSEAEDILLSTPKASGKRWASCRDNAQIQHYTATDGVHWWIGAPVGTTSKAFNATDIAWDFVKQFTLPSSTTSANEEQETSYQVHLFPNPASEKVTISFSLPRSEYVSLRLTDILGNEVEELYADYLRQGNYEFSVHTSSYTSGIFLVRVQYGSVLHHYPLRILH